MLSFQQAYFELQAVDPLPPAVIKHIAKELKDLQEKPEEGIKVAFSVISTYGQVICSPNIQTGFESSPAAAFPQ